MRHSGGLSERLRVTVLCGGWSDQREASLQYGAAIVGAIAKKYEVLSVDPVKDLTRFAAQIISARPDIILNALQGDDANIIATTLELSEIPQAKCDVDTKKIAFDQQVVTLIEETLSTHALVSA